MLQEEPVVVHTSFELCRECFERISFCLHGTPQKESEHMGNWSALRYILASYLCGFKLAYGALFFFMSC